MEEGKSSAFEEEHDFLPCSWAKKVELPTFEGLVVIKNYSLCCVEKKPKMVKENYYEKQGLKKL